MVAVVDRLTSFFVRRNLTGSPQTYALPKLFMTIIEKISGHTGAEVVGIVTQELRDASSSDDEFLKRLEGPIYEENSDVARFILTTLSEDAMTKETWQDLWAQEKGHFVWTIEHILPQGANLPDAWKQMLGGAEAAAAAQDVDVHRLGNLTITAYNSTLGNKSFADKRDRTDTEGRYIGYRNGLALNKSLAAKESWTVADIETRTRELAEQGGCSLPARLRNTPDLTLTCQGNSDRFPQAASALPALASSSRSQVATCAESCYADLDLQATVRRCPLVSTADDGDCYSPGYSVTRRRGTSPPAQEADRLSPPLLLPRWLPCSGPLASRSY